MSPLRALLIGALAGALGSLIFSLVARVLPERKSPGYRDKWSNVPELNATAGAILLAPVSPGPEGLAEQFAFKWASGIFGIDISGHAKLGGFFIHLLYGAAWGGLFNIVQATYSFQPIIFGLIWGVVVWFVGPIVLVPRMKILGHVTEEPWPNTTKMFVGHLIYGLVLTLVCGYFEGSG